MITLCHKCESECHKYLNEVVNPLGWEEYRCPNCGERFLMPLAEFKDSEK